MIKYLNLSGKEVNINDTPVNIAAAEKAGWTKKPKGKKAKKVVDNGDS